MRLRDVIDRYHVADARDLDEFLPGNQCVDVTITSPPYWNVKDYEVDGQIGFGQSYESYLADLSRVFSTVYERTQPTGSLWVISDTFKENGELKLLPFDISKRLTDAKWILQDVIIWQKDRTLPWSHQGKLRNIFEYIAFYSKTRDFKYHVSSLREITDLKDYWIRYPERYSPDGRTPSRTWHVAIPRQGSWGKLQNHVRHSCPLPPELIRRILSLTTDEGDVVLDPFAGSGTVLATARAMRRHYIGTDLSTKYAKMFRTRVLPALGTRHVDSPGIAQADTERATFRALVTRLRQLKFAKELARLTRSTFAMPTCRAVVVLPGNSRKPTRYIMVMTSAIAHSSRLRRALYLTASKPPLSKYGILPAIEIGTLAGIAKRLRNLRIRGELSIYNGGRFYARSSVTTTDHISAVLADMPRGRHPLIVSPLALEIDPARPTEAFRTP